MIKTLDLNELLSGQVFAFLMIFARLGSAFMLFPGIGEPFVAARVRLVFALAICFLLLPVLGGAMPASSSQPAEILRLMGQEIMVGLFFGTMLRFLISALETAGSVISMQIGLSNASVFNPAMATQGTLPSAMLGAVGIVLLFVTGFEDMLIRGLLGTYEVFVPGQPLLMSDMSESIARLAGRVFALGLEIAAPFLVIGLLMMVALGLMARLMPQLQMLILALPLQICTGLALFGITLSGIMLYWLQSFQRELQGLMGP